jgi:hypothetical protein
MFPPDSFACNFVAGFLPVFSGGRDCSWEFVISMAAGCLGSLIYSRRKAARSKAFFAGIAAYFICLTLLTLAVELINPTKHFDLGWLLFAYLFLLPRAALSSALGLIIRQALLIALPLVQRSRRNG